MMESMGDRPPTQVMASLARGFGQAGFVRLGVMRSALFEVTSAEGEEEILDEAYSSTQVMIRYLERQMDAGRLRRMDPVLALQSFLAPVMLHAVSRPALERYGLLGQSLEDAVQELTDAWLRAMAPPRRRRAPLKPAASAPARKKARPSPG
jgi:hypothetical protein